MRTITSVELRQNAARVLRRTTNGERLVLSHPGRPAARLEPVDAPAAGDPDVDPFLSVARRATASPKGRTKDGAIERILYGRG
jgi:antitoxin (DNA-binding transcriptional repressor) of toxin-antitoxin stability system